MKQLIGRRDRPISTETIKEITTQDGSRRIELWRAVFVSYGHDVAVFYVDLFTQGKLDDRWLFEELGVALDKYYDLIESAYKTGSQLQRTGKA